MTTSPVRFSVIGLNHDHIYGMVGALKSAGATLVAVHAIEDDLFARFSEKHPEAKRVADKRAILDDGSIQVVLSAAINNERAPLGVEVMRAGKDFLVDKPGVTSLEQLAEVRKVQKQTGRRYAICFSERLEQRATVKAGELVKAGAIGAVIQTVGLGPHHMRPHTRPSWFFKRAQYGGILCDIASHQFDQFLYFTGARHAEIVAAHVANRATPQYPELEDFGEVLVRTEGATSSMCWPPPQGTQSGPGEVKTGPVAPMLIWKVESTSDRSESGSKTLCRTAATMRLPGSVCSTPSRVLSAPSVAAVLTPPSAASSNRTSSEARPSTHRPLRNVH